MSVWASLYNRALQPENAVLVWDYGVLEHPPHCIWAFAFCCTVAKVRVLDDSAGWFQLADRLQEVRSQDFCCKGVGACLTADLSPDRYSGHVFTCNVGRYLSQPHVQLLQVLICTFRKYSYSLITHTCIKCSSKHHWPENLKNICTECEKWHLLAESSNGQWGVIGNVCSGMSWLENESKDELSKGLLLVGS